MSKIDKDLLIQMKREGKSNAECAKVFGCSADSVRKMVKRLEAEGGMTPATIENAEDYIAEKRLQTEADEEICYEPVVLNLETKHKTVAEWLAEEEEADRAKTRAKEPSEAPAGKYADVVYDPAADGALPSLPPPPIDRKTFWAMRRDELRGAICEYACEGLRVDPVWVEEYNELVERYSE